MKENGLVLRKKYRVLDAETGREVEDAVVLEPEEDQYARTAMSVYARCCGVTGILLRLFWNPASASREDLDKIQEESDLRPGDNTYTLGDGFYSLETVARAATKNSNLGLGGTSLQDVSDGMDAVGFEFLAPVVKVRKEVRT